VTGDSALNEGEGRFDGGIGREAANEVLETGAGDEADRLKVVIEKKKKLGRYKDDNEKLAKYLTSQGFSWQLVKEELLMNRKDT